MVNVISNLNSAIQKLREAEELVELARRAFPPRSPEKSRLDAYFEDIGDTATGVSNVLSSLEEKSTQNLIRPI